MNLTQTAVINGHDIKNMLLGAYAAFAAGYRQIDELNVFPVPDGDTGTNMMRTMEAVHRALLLLDTDSAAEVGAAAAKSAIMGARGNSGVILSQLFAGWQAKRALQATSWARPFSLAFYMPTAALLNLWKAPF